MPILGSVIRPPAEAESFLLQLTLGCSEDHCTFCGAYKDKPFRVKEPAEALADIRTYASRYPKTRRVFLMDGDALVLGNGRLVPILEALERSFLRLSRVAVYASGRNIVHKTDEELKDLASRKLTLFYMGLESGSQKVLERCRKTSSVEDMVHSVRRAACCGIKTSVIVLLGLGGRVYSREHVLGTIEALNQMQPRYLSFLSLMVIPGTPLAEEVRRGEFQPLQPDELLQEMHDIIKGLQLERTVFRSDHASNHLPLEGVLPKDKARLLSILRSALDGDIGLRPEFLRGL